MVDLSAHNLTIKSSVHDYKVDFVDDFSVALQSVVLPGDVIVIDRKVKELYATSMRRVLDENKFYTIEATEGEKSYLGVVPVIEFLIRNKFRKSNRLIALGGGVVQDITAFISFTLFRGVEWIFFPTTLLAQCDSCIGSKVAINFGEYKNQIGGFYPPKEIYIDMNFLETLSSDDIKSGLGEMLHYYIVSGKEDYMRFVEDYDKAASSRGVLQKMILKSLLIKKNIVEIDELDKKERQVFNYGHSFGHALESVTNHRLPHGIAVAYGMDMANFVSMRSGFITKDSFGELHKFLTKVYGGFDLEDVNTELFIEALTRDKKNNGSELGLILMRGIGDTFKIYIQADAKFIGWVGEYFKEFNKEGSK